MNIRPLTYASENPTDLTPLTPSLFLQDVEEVGVPDLDLVEATDLNQRLMYRQQLKQILNDFAWNISASCNYMPTRLTLMN